MDRDALIVQFATDGRTADLDWLVGIEDALTQGFTQNGAAEVDGHDFGRGTMNIFILRKASWTRVIEVVMTYLSHHRALERATIVKRLKSGRHVVVWPTGPVREFNY